MLPEPCSYSPGMSVWKPPIPRHGGESVAHGSVMVDAGPSSPVRADRSAWGVCWLMFASTVLCYMDRQTISLVKPKIVGEFHISNEGFGWVLAAFQLTYAVFQVPAGYLTDRGNARLTYAGAVGWWSLAG